MFFNKRIYGFVSMVLTGQLAMAGSMGAQPVKTGPAYVVTFSAGPTWVSRRHAQTLFLEPTVQKTYTARRHGPTLAIGELFFALQQPFNDWFSSQLGLEIASTSEAKLSGHIWDEANPNLNNHRYNYQIRSSRLSFKAKVLMHDTLFVMASIGASQNRAGDFTVTPLNGATNPVPAFLSSTDYSVAFALGAGIQKAINQHWQAGLAYEYTNWGKSILSPAPGQTVGQGLQVNHHLTQQMLCSVSYRV